MNKISRIFMNAKEMGHKTAIVPKAAQDLADVLWVHLVACDQIG
jgi:hypothetical protein